MSKKSSKSNKSWFARHQSDIYVKKSRSEGYRSRAAYKLLEINEKDHIFKPGMTVIDLGAAPGGWSQVAKQLVGSSGKVIGLDILEMEAVVGVDFIQGDFTEIEVLNKLCGYLTANNITRVDVVISDMSPNLTGINTVDQEKSMYLIQLAYDFAKSVLTDGGVFLAKAFHGAKFEKLVTNLRKDFNKLLIRKPEASRAKSKEVYLLATGYNL